MKELLPITRWQFVNSANKPDILHDSLSPDVPIYGPDAPSDMEKPDSSWMDSSLRHLPIPSSIIRESKTQLPQEKAGRPAEKARYSNKIPWRRRLTGANLGPMVAAIAGSQFRLRVVSVLIFGSFARLMCWDRAAAVVTERFNYTEEPYLSQFF